MCEPHPLGLLRSNLPMCVWQLLSEGPRPFPTLLSGTRLPRTWATQGLLLREPKAVTFFCPDLVRYHRFRFIESLCWAPRV